MGNMGSNNMPINMIDKAMFDIGCSVDTQSRPMRAYIDRNTNVGDEIFEVNV